MLLLVVLTLPPGIAGDRILAVGRAGLNAAGLIDEVDQVLHRGGAGHFEVLVVSVAPPLVPVYCSWVAFWNGCV